MPKRKMTINKGVNKAFMEVHTVVNKAGIERFEKDGRRFIRIVSMTLPEDVVMNGGLYPTEERNKAYHTLDGTLAPIGHPKGPNGEFLSAKDAAAINEYHVGAHNENPRIVGNRIAVDKVIDVLKANESEKGKQLLDRIKDLETNADAAPIHTSTGLFLDIEVLDTPMTNAAGQEYSWIARNMFFDHDAILLNEIGAATPEQGVGMGVNSKGEQIQFMACNANGDEGRARTEPVDLRTATNEMSFSDIRELLCIALQDIDIVGYVVEVYDSYFIYEQYIDDEYKMYKRDYSVGGDRVEIGSIAERVIRKVTYEPAGQPSNPETTEGDAMKEYMLKLLAEMGITANESWTDEQIVEEYEKAMAANRSAGDQSGDQGDDSDVAKIAAAVNALNSRFDSIENRLKAQDESEKGDLIKTITNSGKYAGLGEATLKSIPVTELQVMAANCRPAHGVPIAGNQSTDGGESHSYDMPE